MDMKLDGKVLVADDNTSNQLLMRVLLTKMGLETSIVGDGQQVLDKLDQEHFDLLLLDIQMPVLNGYETAKALRQAGNEIPIIALTASLSPKEVQECKEVGCNEYLQKPISKQNLFNAIHKYLSDEAKEQNKFNDKAFISSMAGNGDLQPVIDIFINDLPKLVDQINNANSHDDMNLISGLAEELKGASSGAGFEVLEEYAASLEKMVSEGQLAVAQKCVDQINEFCKKLIEKQST